MAQVAKAKKKTKKKPAPKKKVRAKKTGAQKAIPVRARRTKAPTKKVYHIFRFTQRFEVKDKFGHYYEWPLEYRRDYVAPKTDEGVHYEKQLSLCDESPNMDALHTAYSKLVRIAAKKSKNYRGYILDGYEPASRKLIAKWLKKEVVECKKILDELEQIGLIEYVPVPDYGPVDDNLVPGPAQSSGSKKPREKKKLARVGGGRGKSGEIGEVRGSFKKTETVNGNRNRKDNNKKKNNKPEPEKKTQPAGARTRQSMTEEQRQERKDQQLRQLREEGKAKGNHPSPDRHPSDTETDKPTETDAGVGQQQTGRSGNPPPSIIDSEIEQFLNNALGGNQVRYSDEAKQFGAEIFRKLKVPHFPTSPQGLKELCSFASVWDKAIEAGLTPLVLSELWASSVKDAVKIAKKRGKVTFRKSAEAVWCASFNRRLEARRRKQAS